MERISFLNKNLKKDKLLKLLSDNKTFVILSAILLFGVFLGAISSGLADKNTIARINALFLNSFKVRESELAFNIFVSSLSSVFFFVLIAFFMGLSLWGCVLAPVVPLVRGFCIGLFQSYLYGTYGLRGICFQLLVLLPGFFLSSIAILLMSREAMRLSHNFLTFVFFKSSNTYDKKEDIRIYLLRTGCVLIIAVLSAILDLIFNFIFLRFFSF
ncbi:MAG: hypothetical protein RUMPE_00373 [Eubacteriales bacterium SKADARSKE-1]|nr:hypothetical protein [Eubacteriales bacterium SKADARSKE-1]